MFMTRFPRKMPWHIPLPSATTMPYIIILLNLRDSRMFFDCVVKNRMMSTGSLSTIGLGEKTPFQHKRMSTTAS